MVIDKLFRKWYGVTAIGVSLSVAASVAPLSLAAPTPGTSAPSTSTSGAAASGTSTSGTAPAPIPLQLPGPMVRSAAQDPEVQKLKKQLAQFPTYDRYRKLAERYIALGSFDEAAAAYRSEAALFRRNGLEDAAIIQEIKASRYDTAVRIFIERQLTTEELTALDTKAVLEPPVGTLLGAYIDLDDQLKDTWYDSQGRVHRNPPEFEKAIGRDHASYFMYISYGRPVPYEWLSRCKQAGVIPHLAYEPQNGLDKVKEDAYLTDFAKFCGRLNWPIFLRYASEMNGSWTAWHGSPALYKEKFRLIHRVFKKHAPLVATVWCVNSVPEHVIEDYYPGDDACDWVGINVYSVPFYEQNLERSGLMDIALPFIDPIYKVYAPRKPIAICEFAASHMGVDRVQRTDFAVSRMKYLYEALPRFYPRVKMISWFDVNTLRLGLPGNPNNYTLTENPALRDAYRETVESRYYLGRKQWPGYLNLPAPPGSRSAINADARSPKPVQTPVARSVTARSGTAVPAPLPVRTTISAPTAPLDPTTLMVPRLVTLGQAAQGQTTFNVWIKTPLFRPKVYLSLNNQIIYAGEGNGTHNIKINADALTPGAKRARVYVYDEQNRFVSTAATTILTGATRSLSRDLPGGAAPAVTQPLQIAGTVQRYYVDRTGFISAVDIETLGTSERVHFSPEMAQSLMAEQPVFSEISAWVLPRANVKPLPTGAKNQAPIRSWNLVGLGDEAPANFLTPYEKTDLDLLESGFEAPGRSRVTESVGIVKDAILNQAGEVVALILRGGQEGDRDRLIQIPPRLRSQAKAAPGATTAPTTITPGTLVRAVGVSSPLITGQVAMYKERFNAEALSINGQKVSSIKFAQQLRGRVTPRDLSATPEPEEVRQAESAGLEVYEPPLPSREKILVPRGARGEAQLKALDIAPLLSTQKRPW